jgi:hypothetical protein
MSERIVALAAPSSASLPEPLTPPDGDLRAYGFMPLEIQRLRRSKTWLLAKRNPEIGFYAMNLWMAAWHELPAGSLEPDDDLLADLAMCDPDEWPRVREEVMRGWVLCADGRLYHPVVAEKVVSALGTKQFHKRRAQAGALARWKSPKNSTLGNNSLETREMPENSPEPKMLQACFKDASSMLRERDSKRDSVENGETVGSSAGKIQYSSLRSEYCQPAEVSASGPQPKPVASSPAEPPPAPSATGEEPEVSQAGPYPADPREVLWGAGLNVLTGLLPEAKKTTARSLIGRWLKSANEDPVLVLRAIKSAKECGAVDPVSWITARLKPKKPAQSPIPARARRDDPPIDLGPSWLACRNRARPWLLEMGQIEQSTGRWCVGGYYVDGVENRVLEAAGLSWAWPGDTKPIAEWLAAGWPSDAILRAISGVASRHDYQPPQSLRYFDRVVRMEPQR